MRFLVGLCVIGGLAVSVWGGAGAKAPVPVSAGATVVATTDDCHCLIESNHGLYR